MSGAEKPSCIPDADKNIDTTKPPETKIHKVKNGDTISAIVNKHAPTDWAPYINQFINSNYQEKLSKIQIGQTIKFEIFGNFLKIYIGNNSEPIKNIDGLDARFYRNPGDQEDYEENNKDARKRCKELKEEMKKQSKIKKALEDIEKDLPGVEIIHSKKSNNKRIKYKGEELNMNFNGLEAVKNAVRLIAKALKEYEETDSSDDYHFDFNGGALFSNYELVLESNNYLSFDEKVLTTVELRNFLVKGQVPFITNLKPLADFLNKVIGKGKN